MKTQNEIHQEALDMFDSETFVLWCTQFYSLSTDNINQRLASANVVVIQDTHEQLVGMFPSTLDKDVDKHTPVQGMLHGNVEGIQDSHEQLVGTFPSAVDRDGDKYVLAQGMLHGVEGIPFWCPLVMVSGKYVPSRSERVSSYCYYSAVYSGCLNWLPDC